MLSDKALDAVWGEEEKPVRVIVSSVIGGEEECSLSSWVDDRWAIGIELVAALAEGFGVINGYDEPQRLGVDRWLAIIAARSKTDGAFCVVDCGTAVTIDIVDEYGSHQGGLIIPGLRMMYESLGSGTNKIGTALGGKIRPLTTNTEDALASGSLIAIVALVERVVAEAGRELESPIDCLLTGGDAACLSPYFSIPVRCEDELVLRGLMLVSGEER